MANLLSPLVGINLVTAGHLADALDRAGRELAERAEDGYAAARLGEVPAVAAARVEVVGRWARDEAAHLRDLVEQLRKIDGGPVRWQGGTDDDFAHPFRGYGLGREVVAALDAGDLPLAARLLAGHEDDPVVATVVLEGLGVDHLLQLLRVGHEEWSRDEAIREVVFGLAEALAAAARHGTTTLGMAELADRADAVDLPRSALGLLFAGGARFSTTFVREAVGSIVAPLNAAVVTQPGLGVQPWMVGGLDTRVLVLEAAADPRTAREAVGAVDLDDLLPGAAGYLDGGVALARVLLAATTPVDVSEPGLAGINAQRVIEWIGRHRSAPLAVHVELGRLAAPWIGSFRSPGLDAVVARPLPLHEGAARSFLTYAQLQARAADDLEDAAWRWAATELDHLARRPGAAGFDAVGSVLGTLTDTGLDADALEAVDEDRRIDRQVTLWHRASQLALARLTGPARRLVSPLVGQVLDRVLPVPDHELRHWRDVRDPAVLHRHLALDYLAASTLWAHGRLPPPPSQLLVDPDHPDRGLRNPLTLTTADAERWRRWRSAMAAHGPAPLQVAGDAFLAETRE
jgi:hypothetical protein